MSKLDSNDSASKSSRLVRASKALSALIIFFIAGLIGCNDAPSSVLGGPEVVVGSETESSNGNAHPIIEQPEIPSVPTQDQDTNHSNAVVSDDLMEQDEDAQETEEGVLGKATRLFNKAKSKSGDTASGASKWVQDKFNGAADAGSQTADDTMKWANDTFESLKSQGLTTAKSTSEWLGQDYTNMDSWEYKVITLDGTDEELAAKLNEFGKLGWDCFNTEAKSTGTRFYFKKQTFSYMRHLPFKDIIKLVPAMVTGEN